MTDAGRTPTKDEGEVGDSSVAVLADDDAASNGDDPNFTSRRVSQAAAGLVALAAVAVVVTIFWPSAHHGRPERAASHRGAHAPAASGVPGAPGVVPGSATARSGSALSSFRTPALGGPATGRTIGLTVAGFGPGSAGGPGSSGPPLGAGGGSPGPAGLPLPGTLPGGGVPLPTVPLPNSLPLPGGLPVPGLPGPPVI